jgi:hypothetical protein
MKNPGVVTLAAIKSNLKSRTALSVAAWLSK